MDFSHPFHNSSQSNGLTNVRRLGDIQISMADRSPCPICGHPTGDCDGESKARPENKLPKQLIGLEPMILLEKDVTELRQITPYTKAKVIIHRQGDYVPLSRARELGLAE